MVATAPAADLMESKPTSLLGHRVAFTGRFATLSRSQAERYVRLAGGRPVGAVTPRTTMLIVGMRGWPLMDSGKVTHKLATAERHSGRCRVVCEDEFREIVGLTRRASGASDKSLDLDRVCATLKLDREAIRRWELLGLVRSSEGLYDFQDLVSLRTVAQLVARGARPSEIRRSLESIAAHVPGIERPLTQLSILISDSGRLVAELEHALLTPSGQFEMNFTPRRPAESVAYALRASASADHHELASRLRAGMELESRRSFGAAEREYLAAINAAPQEAGPRFNLGNALLAQRRYAAAAERYSESLSIDPSHAAAWFNLAHARELLNQLPEAIACLERAVEAEPTYADAHFNLADLAERLGRNEQARRAWTEYLRLDSRSEWSKEARRRLQRLRGPAWA